MKILFVGSWMTFGEATKPDAGHCSQFNYSDFQQPNCTPLESWVLKHGWKESCLNRATGRRDLIFQHSTNHWIHIVLITVCFSHIFCSLFDTMPAAHGKDFSLRSLLCGINKTALFITDLCGVRYTTYLDTAHWIAKTRCFPN